MSDERVHPESSEDWRAWLEENHATSTGVWVVSWKSHTGKNRIPYADEVTEALAYGWVDSKKVTLDADRTMMWYCPRKPTSGWSRPNKQRVETLLAECRMTPAGQRSIGIAKGNGAWTLLDDVEDLVVPPDLAAAFRRHKDSAAHWESFPPSAKRAILQWIVQAKRPETRAKRIRETAEKAALGERANQWTGRSDRR